MINFRSALQRHRSKDKLWSSPTEFDEAWKKRIATMASYINVPGTVADFGCGMMWLEQYLGDKHRYFPIDYIRRDDRTLVLDFNAGSLPEIDAQVAFLSGALEYVVDLKGFVARLTEMPFQQIVISYCTIERNPKLEHRRGLNWVNHESLFNLISYFCPKYDLTHIDGDTNTILVFRRKTS